MNLTIFGANGRVGKLVVRRALEQGHQVQAFVHSQDPFGPQPSLRVSAGEVTDVSLVDDAVGGADAVISTLGTFRRRTAPVLASGVQTIVQAMNHHHGARLVVLTGAGVIYPRLKGRPLTRLNRTILTLMDRTAVADVDRAITCLAATDLHWTTVCAPTITADGPSGYALMDQMPSLLGKVSGPAVAAALVSLAETTTPNRYVVGIKQASSPEGV